MARLIDADLLWQEVRDDADITGRAYQAVKEHILGAKTVDAVEVVHGRWENAEYHGFLRCSECKDVYIDDTWVADGKWNYCPNCGAKTDGGEDND